MLKNYFARRRSIVFTWLLSYALVLVIPVIIALITYIQAAQVVEKQINSSNTLLLKKIRQQMDGLIYDAEFLSEDIAMNTRITNILRAQVSSGSINDYDIYLTVQDLRNYRISNTSIDEYYVYFKNLGMIISGNTASDVRSFYDAYISNSGVAYDSWLKTISGVYRPNQVTVFSLNQKGRGSKAIAFVRTIPFVSESNNDANIVVTMDESKFMDDARDIRTLNGGLVLIINRNNEVIASSDSFSGMDTIKYEDLKSDSGILYKKLSGEPYVLSYSTSSVYGWKYIALVPANVFWEKADYLRNLAIAGLVLCLVLGGVITYFSVKKNYNPILSLIQLLEAKQGLSFNKKNNEYLFIRQVIDKIHSEKEKVDSILKQQNKELKAEFISRLIKGRVSGDLPLSNLLDLYEMTFKSDSFAVVVFYIEDFDEEYLGDIGKNTMENYKLVQFIITNVVEEMVGQSGNQAFVTDQDEMLVCLVNFSEDGTEGYREELERVATEAQAFVGKHFNISFIAAISGMHNTVAGIPGAYREALQALEYKRMFGIKETIHYKDIIGLPRGDYYYPLDVEQQLINCIKTGSFEESKNILEDIFGKNFEKSFLSLKIARCLMFDLVSTMIKTVNDTKYSGDDVFLDALDPVERLLNCENIKDMKQEMIKILDTFCSYITDRSRSKVKENGRQLATEVMKYVQSNYWDLSLGVTEIAQKFNVHLVYLSKAFKENTGEGLLDYINKVRIAKAKALLKKCGNLEEVAKQVGYTNIRTFARVFKKFEGITAGKYKEL